MKTRFTDKVVTFPNDVWTIKDPKCICNSITVSVTDGITPEKRTIPNCKENWRLIEEISKVSGRKVIVETPNGLVDWADSEPRKYHIR